ncbi:MULTISPECIES: hypothetical protein [Pseudothermotoga]|jgi:hypothetical protein|uniref:Uncharacterized protein n=1 Tax=Pseudothermotoga lettingae (strain ATCC BAA-301 / DSM 14385 / NBRC 107922 / TMO) TaxID=416591 RepID=A8F4U8_PSELT|nr:MULTISPECIES: hypothetical protein [Pseudothermotoga]ABV33182.1 conserved hypothetical protein [Pseudothermotoga lettingae TMO]KUK19959.1 MAG: Uncharacterized protein XD56_2125 [Pseudothermotoga lettingae]MDI3494448.1 hypothetical protein [Pseudothermotoga sp.]MDK2884187.1 hypothetical protein [Pseudothermotoga sp.]GLI49901.1 hypothetical protein PLETTINGATMO_20700 [Pseudothermotoga lettingae TMO]
MITPVDFHTIIVRGNEVSSNIAQIIGAQLAAGQLLNSQMTEKSRQQARMVNPKNPVEGKLVKSSTEERGAKYYSRYGKQRSQNKEENKGSILDVRL